MVAGGSDPASEETDGATDWPWMRRSCLGVGQDLAHQEGRHPIWLRREDRRTVPGRRGVVFMRRYFDGEFHAHGAPSEEVATMLGWRLMAAALKLGMEREGLT